MIVDLAIVPNKLNIIERFLHKPILVSFEFLVNCVEIHWVFDDESVVCQSHTSINILTTFPVHRILEIVGLWFVHDALNDGFDLFGLLFSEDRGGSQSHGREHSCQIVIINLKRIIKVSLYHSFLILWPLFSLIVSS